MDEDLTTSIATVLVAVVAMQYAASEFVYIIVFFDGLTTMHLFKLEGEEGGGEASPPPPSSPL